MRIAAFVSLGLAVPSPSSTQKPRSTASPSQPVRSLRSLHVSKSIHDEPISSGRASEPVSCESGTEAVTQIAQALLKHGCSVKHQELHTWLLQAPGLLPSGSEDVKEMVSLAQDNVACLSRFLSPVEVQNVLRVAPAVLAAELSAWFDFLQQYGFTDAQISYLLCQAPQALAAADLMTAGEALSTMQEAGLDSGSVRALCVSYPQLLHSSRKDIAAMLRTLSRFSTGVLDVSC